MIRNYWSCSKFGDWVRGTKILPAGTSAEWRDWRGVARQSHPYRYWLVEEAFDNIQYLIYWPWYKIENFRNYVSNRFITKTHVISSTLKKGDWYDMDHRILYCLMDSMIDFVEIELAHHFINWNNIKFKGKRSSEYGMAHLEWSAALTNKDYKKDNEIEELTEQALNAIELLEIYTWWKDIRPGRKEADEISGWSALCERREAIPGNSFIDWIESEEDRAETKTVLDKYHKIEYNYYKEDEDYMFRLIKIRHSLWV